MTHAAGITAYRGRPGLALLSLLLVVLLSGCSFQLPSLRSDANRTNVPGIAKAAGSSRLVIAVLGVHTTLQSRTAGPGRRPGFDSLEELVSAGLAHIDDSARLRPQLALAVPTLENGLWRIFPDGRMETTWKIKPGAKWHDGTAVTSEDFTLTAAVAQDPDVPAFRDPVYAYVDRVEAPDPATIAVTWLRPYIEADRLFTSSGTGTVPLPSHILEPTYSANKGEFLQHPHWAEQFVGTGPFRVTRWIPGSSVRLQAFDQYVLGRPNIDEIEVRFIPDPAAMLAGVRAGEVQFVMGWGVSAEEAAQMRDQWRDGRADVGIDAWIAAFPQMLNPNPAVIGNARFREALLLAIDREEMAESIQHGVTPVADAFVNPTDPNYGLLESRITRYEHDPRRAREVVEALGYLRGAGGIYRDTAGQPLEVELRGNNSDILESAMQAVGDYWRRLGLQVDLVGIPQMRATDREYRATRPGFEVARHPADTTIDGLQRYHSSQVPQPSNNFAGTNRSRYANRELDGLLEQYFATIPRQDRFEVLGRIVSHLSRELIPLPLFYDQRTALVSNRLLGAAARQGHGSTEAWNAETWTLK